MNFVENNKSYLIMWLYAVATLYFKENIKSEWEHWYEVYLHDMFSFVS